MKTEEQTKDMGANNEIKVSKYTKTLAGYLSVVDGWYKELVELERNFQDETDGWELTGILVNDHWFENIKNELKDKIAKCVKLQLEFTKGKEI